LCNLKEFSGSSSCTQYYTTGGWLYSAWTVQPPTSHPAFLRYVFNIIILSTPWLLKSWCIYRVGFSIIILIPLKRAASCLHLIVLDFSPNKIKECGSRTPRLNTALQTVAFGQDRAAVSSPNLVQRICPVQVFGVKFCPRYTVRYSGLARDWLRFSLGKDRGLTAWATSQPRKVFPCSRYMWSCYGKMRIVSVCSSNFFCGAAVQSGPWPLIPRFLDHTQRRTTLGRTSLDEWSACPRDLYLTHAAFTTDKHPCLRPYSTHNLSKGEDVDLRLP